MKSGAKPLAKRKSGSRSRSTPSRNPASRGSSRPRSVARRPRPRVVARTPSRPSYVRTSTYAKYRSRTAQTPRRSPMKNEPARVVVARPSRRNPARPQQKSLAKTTTQARNNKQQTRSKVFGTYRRTPEHDRREFGPVRATTCKERPIRTTKSGSGRNSPPFIPWCKGTR